MKILAVIAIIASASYSASKAEVQCYRNLKKLDKHIRIVGENLPPKNVEMWNDRIGAIISEQMDAENAFRENTGNTCTYVEEATNMFDELKVDMMRNSVNDAIAEEGE